MARGQTLGSMVFNKPQLIALDALQPIVNYLSNPEKSHVLRQSTEEKQEVELKLENYDSEYLYQRAKLKSIGINPDTMVGTLDVSGSLMYRKGSMGADCTELTSYEGLKRQTEDMISEGVKSIVLMVDSGGGMAFGMASAANYISKITKQAGVKTTAYVDGSGYSAAYGLSVLADEVVLNPQSSVGSVGVVVALYNDSKMLENAGVSRQFVFAGENKIPFDNKTGEFTESFISDLQKSVNKTYTMFTRHVATHRGMSEQAVIDTQAATFDAEEALELGLADKIMELEDFELEYGLKVSSKSSNSSSSSSVMYELSGDNKSTSEGNMPDKKVTDELLSNTHENKPEGNVNMEQLTQLTEQNTQLSAQLTDMGKELSNYKEQVEKLTSELQSKEMAYRNEQRKASLEAALGKDNEEVAEMLASTESLSDEHFNKVVSTLAATQVNVQENLEEKGGEGQDSDVKLGLSEQLAKRAQEMNARKAH